MTASSARIQAGGTLIPGQHVYIARPEDDLLLRLLLERQFCNVLTSRQMGKSSLMIATAAKLRERGVAVSTFDVAGEIGNEPDQEVAWRTIVEKIATDLGIQSDPDQWWESQPEGTNNRTLLRFFRDFVGKNISGQVVIFFDEIDATLRLPYGDDLFTALRTIYNERATEEAYARLTFCVVGVATPNELVKDPRTTAYNIGTDVHLRDFDADRDDLSPLRAVLGVDQDRADPLLRRILYWTGGHPYLTLRFCRELAGKTEDEVDAYTNATFRDLAEMRSDSHFQQILRFFNDRLTEGDAAVAILERIIRGRPEPDRPTLAHAQLKLSGLVKPNRRSELVIRNRIYARLFDRQWLRSLAPKKKVVWLRRYAIAASIVVLLAAGLYVSYRGFVLPRTVAREYQRKLQSAALLRDAKEYRAILAGERPDPVTGITLSGYKAEADSDYRSTSERWRAVRHARALEMIGAGEIEKGLILGAYIAAETGGKLDPVFEKAYEERGYEALITTLRSNSPFDPGLAVSADGRDVAVGNVLWREEDATWRAWSVGGDKGVNAVAFGPAGLYTGDDEGAIKLWTAGEPGRVTVKAVTVVEGRVLDLAVAPDGVIATIVGNSDALEPLSIVDTPGLTKVITSQSPTAIAFANDGRTIVTAVGSVLMVRPPGGRFTYQSQERSSFRDVAVSAGGTLALAEARSVGLFERLAPPRPMTWIAHAPPVRSIAISDAEHLLATVSDEGVRVFALPSAAEIELSLGDGRGRRGSDAQAVELDERQKRLVVRRRDAVQIWSLEAEPQRAKQDRLAEWQRKFSLRVTPSEEIVPITQ